jgi:hypothetical protein
MSQHNIIGSEAFHRGTYAPGFGSLTVGRLPPNGRLLKRVAVVALAFTGFAVAAALRSHSLS